MGSDLRGAGRQVPHRLHVREGAEEGPAQAGPALLLPDGGGEGQPRLRRDGRRDPRQHVPPGPAALDGVAEAVPEHHPVPGDLGRARDAAGDRRGAEPGGPQRPRHPDDRRGASLDDPDEPQAAVHEPLHRSRRVRHHGEGVLQLLRRHDRPPVRRGLHHRRRDHRRERLPDHRRRDGVHERPLRGDARRGRRQRRLPAADRVPLGAVRRVAPHLQRLLDHPHGARRRAQPRSCWSATCATPGGTTTASSTPRSARSSSTARRTAARTATATPSRGGAGSTTTTTAATSCRSRSTA